MDDTDGPHGDDLLVVSDEALLVASQTDPARFAVVYDRHVARMIRYFYVRTADAQTALDLTAETFAAAFASRHRFRDRGLPAAAWLFTIARRQLSHAVRRQRIDDRHRRALGMDRVVADDDSLERIEALVDLAPLSAAVAAAVARLPEAQSRAVMLRVGHDLPYSTVAAELGCSEGAARVRVMRGLSALAEELDLT